MSIHDITQAEASFQAWERERKTKRYNYWHMLKRAKNEYYDLTEKAHAQLGLADNDFYYYLQRYYGVQVVLVEGMIVGDYTIVDEKKHMLFLMKYAS